MSDQITRNELIERVQKGIRNVLNGLPETIQWSDIVPLLLEVEDKDNDRTLLRFTLEVILSEQPARPIIESE